MEITTLISNYAGYILASSILWVLFVEFAKRHKIARNEGKTSPKKIRGEVTEKYLFKLSYPSFLLIIMNIIIASSAVATYAEVTNANKILNRPYIAADITSLDGLGTGIVKSDLEDLSKQLIEKRLKFSILNTGQSPALFRIDLSELKEVGVKKIVPQENSEGVIFPGERKDVKFLLEIHSSFPSSDLEKGEQEEYVKQLSEVRNGDRTHLSRITIFYDYLNRGTEKFLYSTVIDQKNPLQSFREDSNARIDAYGFVWVTGSDSK